MVSLPVLPSKSSVVMQLNRGSVESSSLDMKTTMTSVGDSKLQAEGSARSHPTNEKPVDGQLGKDLELQEQEIMKPIKAAKIHDFCFGIPFGGLVLSGGFVGFLFQEIDSSKGESLRRCLFIDVNMFIMLAKYYGYIFWMSHKKHFHNYSLTKKFFPAGFYAIMSVAMLCFYSYVMISGGNPPPKKKLSASSPTS
ncbi:hypothetical protein MKX01_011497 [Papaver californicum]|nr:hypothetical protein MKX01_011497 [Papaver californicum]